MSYAIRDGAPGVVPPRDLDPDDKCFAALMPADPTALRQSPNGATLLLNSFDEVERRVAAHK